jgi:sec-independent protein translocase protein TatA
MMGIGLPELMIILVIIMIIFGAGKLPEIGSAFGRSIKNFKTSMKDAQEEDEAVGAENQNEAQAKIDEANLTDEEKAALARQKAEEEGAAKDKAMVDEAQAFTDSLPRKGSYDYAQDQADQASKKA